MTFDAQINRTKESYDLVQYDSLPFDYTHPARIAAIASLFGMNPVRPSQARILEIGCAAGGNILPVAMQYPDAECVGIDISEKQIAEGERVRAALGVTNLSLRALNLLDLGDELGKFDYIIAHGVLSWVPATVQMRLAGVMRDLLTEQGIGYLSYNTYPGWHCWEIARHLMFRASAHLDDPKERMAAALKAMNVFAEHGMNSADKPIASILKAHLASIEKAPAFYVAHEFLEDNNAPLYFRDFVSLCANHDLRYLADMDFAGMFTDNYAPAVREYVESVSRQRYDQEELLDYASGRTFRRSLVVHGQTPIDLNLEPRRLLPLYVASELRVAEVQDKPDELVFVHAKRADARIGIKHALQQQALTLLGAHWPNYADLPSLLFLTYQHLGIDASRLDDSQVTEDLNRLAEMFLQLFQRGLIELQAEPQSFSTVPGECPIASPLARWQAEQGRSGVTTLLHSVANLDDGGRLLLPLLDGRRDRTRLLRDVANVMRTTGLRLRSDNRSSVDQAKDPAVVEVMLNSYLETFARSALLCA